MRAATWLGAWVLLWAAQGEAPAQAPRPATQPGANSALPTARPEEVGLSAGRLRRIHEAVQRPIHAHRISGAVPLVARRGRAAPFERHRPIDLEPQQPLS